MIAEYRPLIFDEGTGLSEEGKCVSCNVDLPDPTNVRKGETVPPSLLFPDAPTFRMYEHRMAGLCRFCLGDLLYECGWYLSPEVSEKLSRQFPPRAYP